MLGTAFRNVFIYVVQSLEQSLRAHEPECSGMVPPGRYWSDAEGVSVVAVDYNASNLARRVAIARPKRTMDDATSEDGN